MRAPAWRRSAFQLGKDLLDRVQVWRVWRQVQKASSGRLDRVSHAGHLVCGQIVQDDDVVPSQLGDEHLLHVGAEGWAVHGAAKEPGRHKTGGPQASHERGRLPVPQGVASTRRSLRGPQP